jgi:hypothetical protein
MFVVMSEKMYYVYRNILFASIYKRSHIGPNQSIKCGLNYMIAQICEMYLKMKINIIAQIYEMYLTMKI